MNNFKDVIRFCRCEHPLSKHTVIDEGEKTWGCIECDCEEYLELKSDDLDYALRYCKCGHPFKIHAEFQESKLWVCRNKDCNCKNFEEMDFDDLGPKHDLIKEERDVSNYLKDNPPFIDTSE